MILHHLDDVLEFILLTSWFEKVVSSLDNSFNSVTDDKLSIFCLPEMNIESASHCSSDMSRNPSSNLMIMKNDHESSPMNKDRSRSSTASWGSLENEGFPYPEPYCLLHSFLSKDFSTASLPSWYCWQLVCTIVLTEQALLWDTTSVQQKF